VRRPRLPDLFDDGVYVLLRAGFRQPQRPALAQGPEYARDRTIERERRQQDEAGDRFGIIVQARLRGMDQIAVRDRHTFGGTGRARGINDVHQIVRAGRRRPVAGQLRRCFCPVVIDTEHLRLVRWQPGKQMPLGQQHRRACVRQHEAEAVLRILRVERNICAARLDDAEDSHDHVERPFDAEPDERSRDHALRDQEACQSVGAAVQFGIGQVLAAAMGGDGARRARRDCLD